MRERSESGQIPTTIRSGCSNASIAAPSRRFSGEHAKVRPGGARLLEQPRRTDGKLRRDEDHGVRVASVDDGASALYDRVDVRPIVCVDRSIVGDPHELGVACSILSVGGETERTGSELTAHEIGETRLVHREIALCETRNDCGVLVERDDTMTGCGDTGRRDDAKVPETGDADSHG